MWLHRSTHPTSCFLWPPEQQRRENGAPSVGESPTFSYLTNIARAETCAAAPASLTQLSQAWLLMLPRPTSASISITKLERSNVFAAETIPAVMCLFPTATSAPPEISCVNFLVQSRTHRRVSSSQAARRTVSCVSEYVVVRIYCVHLAVTVVNLLKQGDWASSDP